MHKYDSHCGRRPTDWVSRQTYRPVNPLADFLRCPLGGSNALESKRGSPTQTHCLGHRDRRVLPSPLPDPTALSHDVGRGDTKELCNGRAQLMGSLGSRPDRCRVTFNVRYAARWADRCMEVALKVLAEPAKAASTSPEFAADLSVLGIFRSAS